MTNRRQLRLGDSGTRRGVNPAAKLDLNISWILIPIVCEVACYSLVGAKACIDVGTLLQDVAAVEKLRLNGPKRKGDAGDAHDTLITMQQTDNQSNPSTLPDKPYKATFNLTTDDSQSNCRSRSTHSGGPHMTLLANQATERVPT